MRSYKEELKLDLIIQGVLLTVPFVSLILTAFDKEALGFCYFGEVLLGAYQVTSAIIFFVYVKDKTRGKYLLACIFYGFAIVYIFKNGLAKSQLSIITTLAIIPILMASYYFWYSWQFYKKYEERD